MNETRQVQRNGIDSKSLDALLSIDVDSYLADALEADFVFHDDTPKTRLTRVFSSKQTRRALFLTTSAAVLLALFFVPYFVNRSDKSSDEKQVASKIENDKLNGIDASTSVALDATSDDLAFWSYGSRLCDSLAVRAVDSTRNFCRETAQEFSACRLCLAQIADKYSERSTPGNEASSAQGNMGCAMVNASKRATSKRGLNFDPAHIPETLTPSQVDYSMTTGTVDDEKTTSDGAQDVSNDSLEENLEKKVDKGNCAEYTLKGSAVLLSSRAPLSTSAPSVRSEETGVYTGVEILYVDPLFHIAREIYRRDKKEEER